MARTVLLTILPPFWPNMPPIGLGYLQGFLAKNSINAQILDLNNTFYNLSDANLRRQWLISCNVYLERNILSIINKNHSQQYHDFINKILGYETVGFSCFKSNFPATLEAAKLLKSRRKNIKIILGGPEITRQFFKKRARFGRELMQLADLLVVGEGEKPLSDYLKRNKENKLAIFEQLDDLRRLPFPRYRGLDLAAYPKDQVVPIQFSRGCIKRCRFCSERLLYKGFRFRRVASVIDEIRFHKEKNHINYFVFFDSLINAELSALEYLCDRIIENFGSINWEAQIAIRDDMSQELLVKMKKSGCYNLFVGLESGCDNTLKKMDKGFATKDALSFFKKLNEAGLFFGISMIVGYPGETESYFKKSLDFVIRNKKIIPKIEQVNPFTYYDGTPADKSADYHVNKKSLERLEIFVREIKHHHFKYTNAFLGNLIEKYA